MRARTVDVQLYTPHQAQMALHDSKARFITACCGRRFGKTVFAANEQCKFTLEESQTLGWWVAPTYRQSEIAYRIMKNALLPVVHHHQDTLLRMELVNRSRIQCVSVDKPDNLRGEGVHHMVIEEAAMIPGDTWYKVLRPMLSDTGGKAIFISTPRGRNWFYHLYQRGIDPLLPDYASFTFPTAANPYIPDQEIADAKRDLPEHVFRQEYLAEFLEESAGVFRNIDGCTRGELSPPQPGCQYILGWDPAKYNDFSVITVLNLNTMHIDHFERSNQVEYTSQLARVADIATRYSAMILMDMSGVGDPLLEQLRSWGYPADGFIFTNLSKKLLIETLAVGLAQGALSFPPIPVLIAELYSMEYQMSAVTRAVQYGAPQGAHDDTVISLALAYYAAARPNVPLHDEPLLPPSEIVIPTLAQLLAQDPFEWADKHLGRW